MNREIKFKAWDKKKNEFVFNGIEYHLRLIEEICEDEKNIDDSIIGFTRFDFQRFDLLQYTGLKDKNGKEIYEGDIVKRKRFFISRETHIGKICFIDGCFIIEPEITVIHEYAYNACDIEVIGNIYNNPELINERSNAV